MHKFKELAKMLGVPYRRRFSTDGYGDLKIDNKGVYSYEDKEYDLESLYLLLSGDIEIIKEEK